MVKTYNSDLAANKAFHTLFWVVTNSSGPAHILENKCSMVVHLLPLARALEEQQLWEEISARAEGTQLLPAAHYALLVTAQQLPAACGVLADHGSVAGGALLDAHAAQLIPAG